MKMRSINYFGGIFCLIVCVYCRTIVVPRNTAVVKGRRMSLECRTSDQSVVREWSIVGTSNPLEKKIFSNWNSNTRPTIDPRFGFSVDQNGSGELHSNDTQSEDGGTYTCSVELENEITKYRAEVIVLESGPVCSVNEQNSSIRIECIVRFSGNWAPKMEWRHCSVGEDHEEGTLFTNGIEDFLNKTFSISTLSAVLYSAKDSVIVSCKTFFEQRHSFPTRWATNVPGFVRLWRSPVFGSKHQLYTSSPSVTIMKTSDEQSDGATSSDNISQDIGYFTAVSVGAVLAITISLLLLGSAIYAIRRRRSAAIGVAVAANKKEKTGEATGSENYDNIPDFYEDIDDSAATGGLNSDDSYEKMIKPTTREYLGANAETKHHDEMPLAESIVRDEGEKNAPNEANVSPYLEIIDGKEEKIELKEPSSRLK